MTPIIDWDVISRIKVPEDRWFTDEEFRKIFVRAYKLSKENVDDMIQWDKDNHFPNRFEPHHNGLSERENIVIAKNNGHGDPILEKNWLDQLMGKISSFEMLEKKLNRILYKHRDEGRKRYKVTPELL